MTGLAGTNAAQAVVEAASKPTLLEALTAIAQWECERVVRDTIEGNIGLHGSMATMFGYLFDEVVKLHKDRICPDGHVLFPTSRQEAQVMQHCGEHFLKVME